MDIMVGAARLGRAIPILRETRVRAAWLPAATLNRNTWFAPLVLMPDSMTYSSVAVRRAGEIDRWVFGPDDIIARSGHVSFTVVAVVGGPLMEVIPAVGSHCRVVGTCVFFFDGSRRRTYFFPASHPALVCELSRYGTLSAGR